MDHSLLIDDDPNQWTATLEFEVHEPLFPIQNVMPHEIENAPLVRIDILKFLHPIWRGTKIYFSPRKYPSTFGFDRSKNWPSLLFDLKLAARQAGYDICSRGWSNKRQKEYRRRLQCSMSIPYAGKKDKEEIQSYKTHQDICDSLSNDGPQNKKSTRRRTTNRPLHRCDACKFFFNIGRDESGAFFLMGGKGNDLHNDHAYGTTEKIKLLIKDRMKPDTTFKIFYGDHLEDLHNPRFILGYWSIRGLGAPLRMMLSAAETNHWAVLYDMEEKEDGSWGCESFMKDKVWLHKEYSPLVNLPFLVDCERDQVISQANAIHAYLGRKLDMLGNNDYEQAKCEELLCEIMDLRNIMVGHAYQKVGDEHNTVADGAKRILDKLEIHLEREYPDALRSSSDRSNICHLVGGKFSSPDFHLWEMLDQFQGYCQYYLIPSLYTPPSRPYICAFKENFESLPQNAAYLGSRLMLLPYNNPYAQFGNTPFYAPMGLPTEYMNQSPWINPCHSQATSWRKQGIVEEQRSSQKRKQPDITDTIDDDALIADILQG